MMPRKTSRRSYVIRIIALGIFALFSIGVNAADTDDVIALVKKNWEARNANDYQTQYDLISAQGALNANSNGTFFSQSEKGTLEELEEDLSNYKESNVEVRYPEAVALSDTVILARYYLEGQIEFADGTREARYRTRVTNIWVREGAEWKARSWHFSPLHDGGVHRD